MRRASSGAVMNDTLAVPELTGYRCRVRLEIQCKHEMRSRSKQQRYNSWQCLSDGATRSTLCNGTEQRHEANVAGCNSVYTVTVSHQTLRHAATLMDPLSVMSETSMSRCNQ